MPPLAASLILLLTFLILVAGVWFYVESMMNSLPYRIGYVSSKVSVCSQALREIIKKYAPHTEEMTYIEPGAGLAHITRWAANEYPWKEVIAIDLNYSLLAVARMLSVRSRRAIWYIRQNVLNFTYPKNSFIYCYLSVPILERLYKEGKLNGSLVVTLTFAIPNVTPTEEKPLGSWQKRLYIYDFRNKKAPSSVLASSS